MDDFEWNVVHEGQLLEAMGGHKPVGVNKYFQMAFICDKFTDIINKDINPDKIWSHLGTMYNLEALDEGEAIPFPNRETEFVLPDADYGSLLSKKEEDKAKVAQKGRETPKNVKEIKKDDKVLKSASKDVPRRDSKDGKDAGKTPAKKEVKKEDAKPKSAAKGRQSIGQKDDKAKKFDDTPKQSKRPTRGSLKSNDDSGSSGKSSPVTVAPPVKRRRI